MIKEVLATKRLVRLIVDDEIFADLRTALFDKWPPEDHKLTYLLSCHKCLSVWAALLIGSGLVPKILTDTLATSEAAILLTEGISQWES